MLDQALRTAFPDFHVDIQWQIAADNLLTTDKIYHGTQSRPILGVAPTGRTVESETVDVMKVWNGKISDHWGVGNLLKMMMHIGAITITPDQFTRRDAHRPSRSPACNARKALAQTQFGPVYWRSGRIPNLRNSSAVFARPQRKRPWWHRSMGH